MVGQHGTTELDHGLFQGPPLRLSVVVTYAIASLGFLIALALFTSQFSIPDVPALEDVEELRSFDDIQQLDSTQLKDAEGLEAERAGWGNAYAAEGRFAVMEATLTKGVLAVEECVYVDDEDGGHWSKRSSIRVEPSDGFTIRDRTGLERTVRYGFEDGTPTDLPVVLGFAERSCNGAWSERISGAEADSLVLLLLIEEDPERIQVLSIQEVGVMEAGNPPNSVAKEVTAREDRGRWALVGTGIAGFFVMVGTPTSLSTDLRRLRKARAKMAKTSGGAAGVLGATGRPFQHLDRGSTEPRLAMGATRPAKEDWILPPPPLPNAYTDFLHWGSRGATPSGASGTDRHTGPCDLHVLQHRRHHLRALVRLARSGPEGEGGIRHPHCVGMGHHLRRDRGESALVPIRKARLSRESGRPRHPHHADSQPRSRTC